MATNVVSGIEKIEIGPAVKAESGIAGIVWQKLENIAPDSVTYTKNADTETNIIPEDKDVAFITFYAPGEPDQITIGVLEQKPEVYNLLFNTIYVPGTTKITTLAKRKVAELAIRITTRPAVDGRKCIIVLPNVHVVTTFVNNLSRTAAEQMVLTGKIGAFTTTTGNVDALSTKTWINADGSVIDSTPVG